MAPSQTALSAILTEADQDLLAECLARVMGHGFGEVRLVIDQHQVRFIRAETNHRTTVSEKVRRNPIVDVRSSR